MTTNPNNAVGTNGAYSGRTSPNALNDVLALFNGRGIVSGWACSPDSGMTVEVGGDGTNRDVAIAEDNAGNRVPVDNISQAPISVTIPAAPANNSRIDAIVAYVENPPMGTSTDTDNPGAVGLIVVSGTVASTPSAPDDNAIRTAITADGASGSTAYYVVLATVRVASGTTTITSTNITAGDTASVKSDIIPLITSAMINSGAVTNTKLNLSLENISFDFSIPNVYTYQVTGKMLKLGNNIGILMFTGYTGMTIGPGEANIKAIYPNANFATVLGASLQFNQSSNPATITKYMSPYPGEIDAYVDNLTSSQDVNVSMIVIGTLS